MHIWCNVLMLLISFLVHTTCNRTLHCIVSVRTLSLLPPDPTLTLHTVTTAVAPVRDWDLLGGNLGVPWAKLEEIRSQHSTDDKRKEAAMDYWLHYCPGVSWDELATMLHWLREIQSLQRIQSYLKKTTGMELFCS